MHSADLTDLSIEPVTLRLLTDEQKERLTCVLDRYLSELEQGVPRDPAELVEEHPDLAEPLKLYLHSLTDLQSVSAGFSNAPDATESLPSSESDQKRLGDFEIGSEIGRGGMGVVYEATQISLQRKVALKVLPFAAMWDHKQIARFQNEAQAAAQLQHANIVPVFAVGQERGVHFYAMQLIDGQSLDQLLRELDVAKPDNEQPRLLGQGLSSIDHGRRIDRAVGAVVGTRGRAVAVLHHGRSRSACRCRQRAALRTRIRCGPPRRETVEFAGRPP